MLIFRALKILLLILSTIYVQLSQANDCTNGWRERVAYGSAKQGDLQVTATFGGSGGITHQGVLLPGTDSRMTIQLVTFDLKGEVKYAIATYVIDHQHWVKIPRQVLSGLTVEDYFLETIYHLTTNTAWIKSNSESLRYMLTSSNVIKTYTTGFLPNQMRIAGIHSFSNLTCN